MLVPDVATRLGHGLGVDPSPVRVHTDSVSASATAALGVRAFTWGVDVFLAEGERPTDVPLLAHEVTHAIQQSSGPAIHLFDGPHGALEHEAHRNAAVVASGGQAAVHGRTSGPRIQGEESPGLLQRGLAFGKGLVSSAETAVADVAAAARDRALAFIKDKAKTIPGYDLLCFILGRDPITQQTVERTAENLIKGVLDLVPGGDALFANLQQAKVIQRAHDWFTAEIAKLNITWDVIRGLFAQAWDALSISDLADPGGAWEKLKGIFGPPLGRLRTFAVDAGHKVLEFVFEGALALAGGAGQKVLAVFQRIGAVFSLIVADPVKFLTNLLDAVKGGFNQFWANIGAHLRTGVFEWLMGAMQGVIQLPSKWDFSGILSLILQILGLTYSNLRAILVKILGEKTVTYLEGVFNFLKLMLGKDGLSAAWEKIKEFASGLADQVITAIRNWIAESVVGAAVTKLVTMFNPVGAVIQGIITIYNTVMFFIERIQQITRLVNSILDSIENIAKGATKSASDFVEKTLANTLPVIIGFLARLVGLGSVTEYIRDIIGKIRATIAGALEKLGLWIKDHVQGLLKGKPKEPGTPAGGKSAAVRAQAMEQLREATERGMTVSQEASVVSEILNRLRGQGLERLELGPEESDGSRLVYAAASEYAPLARLVSEQLKPGERAEKGRSERLYAEVRFNQPVNIERRSLPLTSAAGKPLPLGSGGAGVEHAGVVIPLQGAQVVRTTSWNTANIDSEDNTSHAEHHFAVWLLGQEQIWPHINFIMVNLVPYSPCGACADDLISLLKKVRAARNKEPDAGQLEAVLSWSKLYEARPGRPRPTTRETVKYLLDAQWDVHAPPAEAFPLRADIDQFDTLHPLSRVVMAPPKYP